MAVKSAEQGNLHKLTEPKYIYEAACMFLTHRKHKIDKVATDKG